MNATRERYTQIAKIARQGGGRFSMVKEEWGKNSLFEIAEFNDRGEMAEQFRIGTTFADHIEATDADRGLADVILAKLIYINEFPSAAEFENVRGSIDRLIAEYRQRNELHNH